jgi:hypothetical protein
VSGRLNALDLIKRQLEERFPGWQVWYVPHLDRTVTWCARPWPLLNEDSPEHLAEAIGQAEAGDAGPDDGKDNVTWLP